MPKIGMHPIRRKQLIGATFEVIRNSGLEEATVATVANAAGLSAGIVAHYFGNKDGLLEATMRQVLRDLRAAVARHRALAGQSPREQIGGIIAGNFDYSQTNPTAMRVWLSFWAASMNKPELARLQRANDRRLYSNLACQFARALPRDQARTAATSLAALIDGLWLRGSLSGRAFDVDQARGIAGAYLDQQLRGV